MSKTLKFNRTDEKGAYDAFETDGEDQKNELTHTYFGVGTDGRPFESSSFAMSKAEARKLRDFITKWLRTKRKKTK